MSAPALAAATTVAYMLATPGAFWLINRGVPPWLETVLSAAAAPGVFALLAWVPLLKRLGLGLARGEMFSLPGPLAFVLITALYATLAYGVVALVARAVQR